MAEGRVAYMGSCTEVLKFFQSVGYPCPQNYNPADFFIHTMAVVPGNEEACETRIETICDAFEKSEHYQALTDEKTRTLASPTRSGVIFEEACASSSMYESPWYTQFATVFKRCCLTTVREPLVIRVKVMQTVFVGVLFGLIYLQLDLNQEGVMDINGALFLLLIEVSFSNMFAVLNTFPIELPIFLREYGIWLYRVDIYFFSKMLAELPAFILIPIGQCAICYWMVGLYASFTTFVVFVGVMLLVANIGVSFGYLVSTVANSVTTALAMAPPLIIPLLMFGGFFLNSDSIPKYFLWLKYMSWFSYANELIAVNQWENVNDIDCSGGDEPKCLFNNGTEVIEYLNYTKDNQTLDIALLFTLLVAYRLIAFIIIFIKAKVSRN